MGTGTTDIIERCEKAGLRTPQFIQDEDFTTILWRPLIEHVPQDDTQGDTQGDTQELDRMIMREIRRNPRVSTDEIAKKTNKGIATIKRHIAKLPNIKYVGSGYSGHWEIVE